MALWEMIPDQNDAGIDNMANHKTSLFAHSFLLPGLMAESQYEASMFARLLSVSAEPSLTVCQVRQGTTETDTCGAK